MFIGYGKYNGTMYVMYWFEKTRVLQYRDKFDRVIYVERS